MEDANKKSGRVAIIVAIITAIGVIVAAVINQSTKSSTSLNDSRPVQTISIPGEISKGAKAENIAGNKFENNYYGQHTDSSTAPISRHAHNNTAKKSKEVAPVTINVSSNNQKGGQTAYEINNN